MRKILGTYICIYACQLGSSCYMHTCLKEDLIHLFFQIFKEEMFFYGIIAAQNTSNFRAMTLHWVG